MAIRTALPNRLDGAELGILPLIIGGAATVASVFLPGFGGGVDQASKDAAEAGGTAAIEQSWWARNREVKPLLDQLDIALGFDPNAPKGSRSPLRKTFIKNNNQFGKKIGRQGGFPQEKTMSKAMNKKFNNWFADFKQAVDEMGLINQEAASREAVAVAVAPGQIQFVSQETGLPLDVQPPKPPILQRPSVVIPAGVGLTAILGLGLRQVLR